MIATIRTHTEYYQQTAVTLMYASRAKKVEDSSFLHGSTFLQCVHCTYKHENDAFMYICVSLTLFSLFLVMNCLYHSIR